MHTRTCSCTHTGTCTCTHIQERKGPNGRGAILAAKLPTAACRPSTYTYHPACTKNTHHTQHNNTTYTYTYIHLHMHIRISTRIHNTQHARTHAHRMYTYAPCLLLKQRRGVTGNYCRLPHSNCTARSRAGRVSFFPLLLSSFRHSAYFSFYFFPFL